MWYLEILKTLTAEEFDDIKSHDTESVFKSTINITTVDSGTLTDGPTIYMTDDVVKIAKFCLQIAKIPPSIISSIQKNIDYNNGLSKKISQLEKDLDDGTKKDQEKEKKISEDRIDESMKVLKKEINRLRSLIKSIELTECYIPNKKDHSMKWDYEYTGDVFTSDIQSETVEKILLLDEPFAALDVMTIKTLQEIIVDLQTNNNISVTLSSASGSVGSVTTEAKANEEYFRQERK